ncbi:MAG: hypothetical protein AAF191_18050 [Verrucomicrobiota bacterium]
MTYDDFLSTLDQEGSPPHTWSIALRSLWYAKRDDWHAAHDLVNDLHTSDGSWVHAHLHRVEGDLGNAGYWYAKAGRPRRQNHDDLDGEWEEITRNLLAEENPSSTD